MENNCDCDPCKCDHCLHSVVHKNRNLDNMFFPKNIAVIGASSKENSVGKTLLWNILRSPFGGMVFPVNPKYKSVLGIPSYANIKDIKEDIDLAVIAIAAKMVPNAIKECIEKKVPAAVIISAGFKELGPEGNALEEEILKYSKEAKIRIIGPNCLGIMNPVSGLNATFATEMALKGNLAFISQSGALCTAVLDWSLKEKVGFSSFVSIGSMIDVNWGDLLTYFGRDENTHSILIYMESLGDAKSFLSAAREVALSKPIILIKAGKTEESAKAASSHTGAMSGNDDVLNAALRRVGVLRVDSISNLFHMADVLAKQPRPKGPHLAILTNAGGPGVIATDTLIKEGSKLAKLDKSTYDQLNEFLPVAWSHNNPIDILGDATPELYSKSIEVISKDPNVDGILAILTPQFMTDPEAVADKVKEFAKLPIPILTSWMGGLTVEKAKNILAWASIPTFDYPDSACEAFAYMYYYTYNLLGIYEVPRSRSHLEMASEKKHTKIKEIFDLALKENRTLLDEYESKKVLQAYDIPVVPTFIAKTQQEAVTLAEKIGFPIVLKLYSRTITHKTDVGGIKLNLNNIEEVKEAFVQIHESVKRLAKEKDFMGVSVQPMVKLDGYELILGSSIDRDFGPVLLFGSGGQLVEVFKDKALALPPLTSTLALRMIEQTKIYKALLGTRGRKAIDINELEKILVRFSHLIAEYPQIKECDINPIFVSSEQIIALDARIILHEKNEILPKLAIRPYPTQYIQKIKIEDREIIIRPILPEDEPLVKNLYEEISHKTVKDINFGQFTTHDRLLRICFNDYDRGITLVVTTDLEDNQTEIIAIARFVKRIESSDSAIAVLVAHNWRNKGIGKILVQSLIKIAKEEKSDLITCHICKDNTKMMQLCTKCGFTIMSPDEKGFVVMHLKM